MATEKRMQSACGGGTGIGQNGEGEEARLRVTFRSSLHTIFHAIDSSERMILCSAKDRY